MAGSKRQVNNIWDAYEGTKDYERFKEDPKEQFKQNNKTNLNYSLIDFCGTTYLKAAELSKFTLFEAVRPYYKELEKHKHTQILLGFNPRLRDNSHLICMMCLHCLKIYGLPHRVVQSQRVDFKQYNDLLFTEFQIYFDFREMSRDIRKNKYDYHAVIDFLAPMFDPEDYV